MPPPATTTSVVVHPLVLLSVVDHYTRVAKHTTKRVVGVLLGSITKGKVDVTNSYAVPFEEDAGGIWFLDHNYHENMFAMFKKVNAKERVVGWYGTGDRVCTADIEIDELFRRYTAQPVYCTIDVNPQDDLEIPVQAYISVENTPEEKSKHRRTFQHVPAEVGAYEAEEVGVEHLLREIVDTSGSSVADLVLKKVNSLKGLKKRMEEMHQYLDDVCEGRLPVNHQIIYNMQDIFNLLPDLRVKELVRGFAVKTNDNMLVMYLSSLIRSIIALHNLINNKITNQLLEAKEQGLLKPEKQEKKKEEEKKPVRKERPRKQEEHEFE